MFRHYPNQMQSFVRHLFAALPRRHFARQELKATSASNNSNDDEVVFPQELGASFFAKNIGKLNTKIFRNIFFNRILL